ncbi:MAG: GreA/GreB family elongation factor [Candidatus Wildermuthbacteria bacterium]|nr:GreA/GreB family elongation factor [Candidatus Wildermuthbacteria bacterium]
MTEKYYLTKKGLEKAKKEYASLLEFKKLKTKGEVPAIWESEDVNPDYLAFQEDMSLLETRLAEYENILKNVELIVPPPSGKRSIVSLGATVTLEIDDGQIDEFEIVGTLESNPMMGKISNESPVGSAFLGHHVGDEVVVSSPTKTTYRIKKIRYTSP